MCHTLLGHFQPKNKEIDHQHNELQLSFVLAGNVSYLPDLKTHP